MNRCAGASLAALQGAPWPCQVRYNLIIEPRCQFGFRYSFALWAAVVKYSSQNLGVD